jgi:small-conductance mechanosensitive channel
MQTEVSQTVEQAAQPLLETTKKSTEAVLSSFERAVNQIAELGPKLVGAVIVLIIGYVVARVLARFVTTLSEKLGLQRAAQRSGLSDSMRHAGVERTIPQIVGVIVFWLLMSVFLVASFDILDLPGMTVAIEKVVAYIPKVLVATVLIVVGLLLSAFIRGVVATSADRVGITYSQQLANGCYYILAMMTFIGAFSQLDIKFDLLNYAILIAFGAVALAFGLSFGLGGREVMSGILCGYYLRQRFQAGDVVRVAGFEGTVRDVGPVATVIETDEDGLLHRRSIPNHLMLNEGVR